MRSPRKAYRVARRFRLAAAFVPLVLCGCSATVSTGPTRIFSIDQDAAALQAAYAFPDPRAFATRLDRNNFVWARMYAIDIEFTEYFSKLTVERQLGTLAGDFATVALGAATTTAHGAALKTALGAAVTAVAGARTAVDKDILVSQTIQVLQSQMEASRLAIKNRIMANLTLDIESYPLPQALSDVEDYYRAGTLAGALESLSAAVGNNSQANKTLTNGVTQNAIGASPVIASRVISTRAISSRAAAAVVIPRGVPTTSAGAPVPSLAPPH